MATYKALLHNPFQPNGLAQGVPTHPVVPSAKKRSMASAEGRISSAGELTALVDLHSLMSGATDWLKFTAGTSDLVGTPEHTLPANSGNFRRLIAGGVRVYTEPPAEKVQGSYLFWIHPHGADLTSASLQTIRHHDPPMLRIQRGKLCDIIWTPRRLDDLEYIEASAHVQRWPIVFHASQGLEGSKIYFEAVCHWEYFSENDLHDARTLTMPDTESARAIYSIADAHGTAPGHLHDIWQSDDNHRSTTGQMASALYDRDHPDPWQVERW